LGIAWFFDPPIQNELPLGGHNESEGWYPILVEHSQYEPYLKDAVTTVVGSVSLDTDFIHPIHKTKASDGVVTIGRCEAGLSQFDRAGA
jgi:hypothetical protein